MSRFLLFALLSLLCLVAPAHAQRESDFEFAMESGDYAVAEEAVIVELARTEASDPSSLYRASLLQTLTSLRVLQEKYAAAIEPAQQALRMLQAHNGDTFAVRLMVARAELGVGARASQASALRSLILEADTQPELAGHIHHGAIQLATWAMRARRFDEARAAWSIALRASDASVFGASSGRGVALIGVATATLYATRPGAHDFAAIQAQYEEGLRLLNRATYGDTNPVEPSREELAYAEAVACYRVWRSDAEAHRAPEPSADLPPTGFLLEGFGVQHFPICNIEVIANPLPRMPASAGRVDAGAAMIWLHFTPEGEIVERRVLAVAGGDEAFAQSVERLAPRWRIDRGRDPNCFYPLTLTLAVVFRFRD